MAERTPPDDTTKTVHPKVLKEIVFGTRIARSMENESPAVIIQTTAERIWSNLSSYLAVGDWPDRRRTAEEVDAEAEADQAAARRPRPGHDVAEGRSLPMPDDTTEGEER